MKNSHLKTCVHPSGKGQFPITKTGNLKAEKPASKTGGSRRLQSPEAQPLAHRIAKQCVSALFYTSVPKMLGVSGSGIGQLGGRLASHFVVK
jgi:hypothetical protein